MTALRLYTERRDNLASLAAGFFDGFNLSDATGAWKGIQEASAIIETVVSDDALADARAKVRKLADLIKKVNAQEAVMVMELPITAEFV